MQVDGGGFVEYQVVVGQYWDQVIGVELEVGGCFLCVLCVVYQYLFIRQVQFFEQDVWHYVGGVGVVVQLDYGWFFGVDVFNRLVVLFQVMWCVIFMVYMVLGEVLGQEGQCVFLCEFCGWGVLGVVVVVVEVVVCGIDVYCYIGLGFFEGVYVVQWNLVVLFVEVGYYWYLGLVCCFGFDGYVVVVVGYGG